MTSPKRDTTSFVTFLLRGVRLPPGYITRGGPVCLRHTLLSGPVVALPCGPLRSLTPQSLAQSQQVVYRVVDRVRPNPRQHSSPAAALLRPDRRHELSQTLVRRPPHAPVCPFVLHAHLPFRGNRGVPSQVSPFRILGKCTTKPHPGQRRMPLCPRLRTGIILTLHAKQLNFPPPWLTSFTSHPLPA